MKRVISATLQALRAEYASCTWGTVKLSTRLMKRAESKITLCSIAEVDAKINDTHKKVKHLGATYMDVLREGYLRERAFTWRVDHLWCPLWPGQAVLVAFPLWLHFGLGYVSWSGILWAEGWVAVIVIGVQSFVRIVDFCDYAKDKHALDFLARKHEKEEQEGKKKKD
jgi:hypothetical protein